MADGRIAGAFVLNDDPGGDYGAGEWRVPLSVGEYMIIHTLAVDPELGGRGIGGEMVRYLSLIHILNTQLELLLHQIVMHRKYLQHQL